MDSRCGIRSTKAIEVRSLSCFWQDELPSDASWRLIVCMFPRLRTDNWLERCQHLLALKIRKGKCLHQLTEWGRCSLKLAALCYQRTKEHLERDPVLAMHRARSCHKRIESLERSFCLFLIEDSTPHDIRARL